MIKASIVADSVNEFGNRLTTMVVTFPRFILAELNTHRMFSRNSASSRAIPFEKMLKSVEENPFIPMAWMKDHKGMQGTEYFTDEVDIKDFNKEWLMSSQTAIGNAFDLSQKEITKQLCNRLLEPFMWHTVIITATEFENFFALRCPKYNFGKALDGDGDGNELDFEFVFRSKKDALKRLKLGHAPQTDLEWLSKNQGQAEIHMMALAEAMYDAYNESKPAVLKAGEWHIPFGDNITNDLVGDYIESLPESNILNKRTIEESRIKIATARCARVSYTVVGEEDKPANYENDIKLHDRLAASGHWSPFEHIAQAMTKEDWINHVSGVQNHRTTGITDDMMGWSGNLRGFLQYRKQFPNENVTL